MPEPVGIVGGGSWGTALANLVAGNGGEALLWMRDPETVARVNRDRENARYLPGIALSPRVRATSDLAEVGSRCKLLLVAVPSVGLRPVMGELGAHIGGAHLLVHTVKGLEAGSLKTMSQVLREETPAKKIGVLSGPNLAREVAEGQPSATVVASRYREVIDAARAALVGPTFRVYGNTDVVGTEIGGALKNVLAIAAGLAHGLGFGDNTRALLLTRGLVEVARFGVHFGAKQATFSGLSGIGDILATCFSPLSRNYQVGHRLAAGETLAAIAGSMNQVAEGVKTARVVSAYARENGIYMPITGGIDQILHAGTPARAVLAALMEGTRNAYEADPEFEGL